MLQDPTYPLFSIFAFLGFIVALIPLPWHLQSWNAGTCIYMLWASLASLVQFVDSLVWNNNLNDPSPVWCDISTKFLIGAGVGIPAASLCIIRRLYFISSIRNVSITREERRRAIYVDVAIGVGIPVIIMALHYVVQGHRYNILEDIGCTPAIFNTALAYPLVNMWPILLGCIAFVYAALTLRRFWQRRIQFNEVLSSASTMTISRYFRLMLLACMEMACTVPLTSYSIFINNSGVQLAPWVSWADTHFNFSHVELIPAIIWRSNRSFLISVELGRWVFPCCALIFFALFGFAEEARRHYRLAFWWIAKRLGYQRQTSQTSTSSFQQSQPAFKSDMADSKGALPVYTPTSAARFKRPESLASSLAETINISADLEKCAFSPLYSLSTTLDGGSSLPSPCDTESDSPSHSSDAHGRRSPDAQVVLHHNDPSRSSPPHVSYHLPFSP